MTLENFISSIPGYSIFVDKRLKSQSSGALSGKEPLPSFSHLCHRGSWFQQWEQGDSQKRFQPSLPFQVVARGKPGTELAAGPRWPAGAQALLLPITDQTHCGPRGRASPSAPTSPLYSRCCLPPQDLQGALRGSPDDPHTHGAALSPGEPRRKTAMIPPAVLVSWPNLGPADTLSLLLPLGKALDTATLSATSPGRSTQGLLDSSFLFYCFKSTCSTTGYRSRHT